MSFSGHPPHSEMTGSAFDATIYNPVIAKWSICREMRVFPVECRGRRCSYKEKLVVRDWCTNLLFPWLLGDKTHFYLTVLLSIWTWMCRNWTTYERHTITSVIGYILLHFSLMSAGQSMEFPKASSNYPWTRCQSSCITCMAPKELVEHHRTFPSTLP